MKTRLRKREREKKQRFKCVVFTASQIKNKNANQQFPGNSEDRGKGERNKINSPLSSDAVFGGGGGSSGNGNSNHRRRQR